MTLRICSRSDDVVEPLLKPQWYVSMKDMAAEAYKAVESGDIIINPKLSEADFNRWMENIRDWCISRQLWWGHQAPVYYIKIEGESQSVRSYNIVDIDFSRAKENGGLQLDQRTKPGKKLRRNSQVYHLVLNGIQMCLTHGSHPVFGRFQQWDGLTTY